MDTKVDYGVRSLAFVLAIGGLVGVCLSIYMAYTLVQQHWVLVVLAVLFLGVFAWTSLTGVRLWRGDPRGKKWAKILYAAQVPILTVPGFNYEYYTGLSIALIGGQAEKNFRFEIGANLSFYLDTRITGLFYGINLFALAALIYLLFRLRSGSSPARVAPS